jgi:hypothetical protein
MKYLQSPSLARDLVAFTNYTMRAEVPIQPFAASAQTAGGKPLHDRRPACVGTPEGQDFSARFRGEAPGEGTVVEMSMCDEDMRDFTRLAGAEDRIQVRGIIRARVDNSDLTFADKEGVGPPMGHRPGIRSNDAAKAVA